MSHSTLPPSRRSFIRSLAAGAALGSVPGMFHVPGLFAQALTLTPRQTEGPFYPTHLPLDTDNDLLIINDGITPAVGEVTHLSGRVLDSKGSALRNVLVEIWQVDHHGAYLHEGSDNRGRRDGNFQGFGRFLTGSTGEYYFRTIKPVPYTGRTPHIHVAVKMKGREKWTTQCYVRGDAGNQRDRLWQGISDPKARDAVTVAFTPVRGSRTGELSARFDLVMGFTPEI